LKRTVTLAFACVALLVACSTRASRGRAPAKPRPVPGADQDRTIRVVLPATRPLVGATGDFRWFDSDGRTVLARGRRGEEWRLERESPGVRVRAIRTDGVATAWLRSIVARPNDDAFVTVNGKRYRGEFAVLPMDSGPAVVNRLGIEDYLRGVVPVEMGKRPDGDSSALRAQAVASRSYAYVRARDGAGAFDIRATTADQVYGGLEVENDASDAAIDATRGLVLRYQGRVVDAPFHSTCGGTTAEPSEVWRTADAPYLRKVSDRIGATDRYYCQSAPRYRWSRTLSGSQINAALEQYLRAYATVPGGKPGTARVIGVRSRTPSGRVGIIDIETDRGMFPLRGNDMRYVLRQPGGEILASTYFSVEPEYRDGLVSRVTFRGQGNGHGVGMCQWGAIGRARAGQSFRTILGTYYPGTTVGSVSSQ
jgi:stage II sporulation protein D